VTLSRIIEHHADRFPERPALGLGGTSVTYAELMQRTHRTAGALRAAGASQGEVVAILLYNRLEFFDLLLGAAHLGSIFMPLNWRLAPPELAYILDHAGARLLVSEPELEPTIEPVRDTLSCARFLRVGGGDGGGWESFEKLRDNADPVTHAAETTGDDIQRLMYTSGTAARPKGVIVTHANLDAKNAAHVVELGLSGSDRGLAAGPLYHVGALDLTATTLLYVGGTTYILPRFDATAVLDAIERHAVTTLWLAPAMVNALLAEPSLPSRDLGSVRILIDGGEKMPLPLIERVLAAFPNAWFADAYGLTETVSGDTFLDKRKVREKLGSVGKPVINLEVRVLNDSGRTLPAGQEGEIVLRGPKVSKGYWRDPHATELAFHEGWFHTGDVGMIDGDGYLYIVDRLKDVIITGGENVSSLEVERALYEHPAMVEAAVVSGPDDRWGEVPVAYVVLSADAGVTEDELAEFCRARLARFKVPKVFRLVDVLPRNPSGKVLKRDLRERERLERQTSAETGPAEPSTRR
jgi:fatty-acyl-CoA synthase